MSRPGRRACLVGALVLAAPSTVSAHVFFAPYTLPVPFWMYLYACAATLIVSFGIIGYLLGAPAANATYRTWDLLSPRAVWQSAWSWTTRVATAGAVGSLVLTIAAGLVGTGDPAVNINMTLFWVVFVIGLTYLTAVAGDFYGIVNPWKAIVSWVEAAGVDLSRARVRYPDALAYYPALAFYIALIWIELFTLPRPSLLSAALLVYTAITAIGVYVFGKQAWFERGDLFGVYFRLVGTLAPLEYVDRRDGFPARIRLRAPFVAALHQRPTHISQVLIVLFMLSSTTYDGIHETFFWVSLYWQQLVPLLQTMWSIDVIEAQEALIAWYNVYQRIGLVLSPFFYLLLYLAVMAGARLLTGTRTTVTELAQRFAFSLIPIALVYHATHYYTIVVTELPSIVTLAADPFGLGWRLFATAAAPPAPLNMGLIWHTQVALMLIGHVAAVYLAHKIAVAVFPSQRLGVLSQMPMLTLMVAYTWIGLWVLSLPLTVAQVLPGG
jgi:hypothetical protein